MRLGVRSVVKAVLVLVLLTVLPMYGRLVLPPEFSRFFSTNIGLDIMDLLLRTALVGVAFAVLILLKGNVVKGSKGELAVSSVWKVFLLIIVLFVLGLGYPEALGLGTLGGKTEAVENIVVIDSRLYAALAAVIVVLMIIRSVLSFQETSVEASSQEP